MNERQLRRGFEDDGMSESEIEDALDRYEASHPDDDEDELIPENMRSKLQAYVDRGEPMGHFLTAVVCNDLKEAVFRADSLNLGLLKNYLMVMYWNMPSQSQGSKEKMDAWIAKCGLLDLTERRALANHIDTATHQNGEHHD